MTRRTLAQAAGVSERHHANLEYGVGNASILVLQQVAGALQCSLAELTGDVTTSSPEWLLIREQLEHRDEAVLRRLAQLGKRKHEVTVFHVLDPAEIEFPFEDPTLFLSMEDARSVEANGRDVRRGYLEVLRRWLDEVRRTAAEADPYYALCRTDRPLDEVLLPFLARRERTAA